VRRDDELLMPGTCGHSVGALGAFLCGESGDHDEHIWRGDGQASRGLGYGDNLAIGMEVRWRDDRPAATVGDVRRALALKDAT
jgi:hypothetical protein